MLIHLKPRLFCYQVKSFINYFSDLKISHPQLFQHFFVLSFSGFCSERNYFDRIIILDKVPANTYFC